MPAIAGAGGVTDRALRGWGCAGLAAGGASRPSLAAEPDSADQKMGVDGGRGERCVLGSRSPKMALKSWARSSWSSGGS